MTLGAMWPVAILGDLLTDIQPGFASGRHNSEGIGLPHLRPMNITTNGRIDRSVLKFVDPALADRPERRLRRGDVLFNNTNSPELVGKTALFDGDDEPAFSNHMTRLRVDPSRLDPGFLALRMLQAWIEGWFAEHCNNHVSQSSVGRDVLRTFPIELPPLDVQRAIVMLSGAIDDRRSSGIGHLAKARRAIERFRQAVLKAACSGKLTEGWRARRRDTWRYSLAGNSCIKVQSGGTPKTGFTDKPGIPFLKVYNIVDQRVDFGRHPQYVPVSVHEGVLRKSIAYPGDVIMNIVGPPLGKVAIIPTDHREWNLNQAITIFRPGPDILAEWLYLYLCSGSFMESEDLVTRGSAGQSNISLTQCRNLEIPLPSVAEQREIVRQVGKLMGLADELRRRIDGALRSIDRSSQAVLAKAFRGDLIPANAGGS